MKTIVIVLLAIVLFVSTGCAHRKAPTIPTERCDTNLGFHLELEEGAKRCVPDDPGPCTLDQNQWFTPRDCHIELEQGM